MKIDFEPLAKPTFITLDLFPATIREGEDIKTKTRVVVTDAHYYVFTVGETGFPVVTDSGALYDFSRIGVTNCTITTEDGRILDVTRDAGCGCGNTLVSFQPFLGVPFAKLT